MKNEFIRYMVLELFEEGLVRRASSASEREEERASERAIYIYLLRKRKKGGEMAESKFEESKDSGSECSLDLEGGKGGIEVGVEVGEDSLEFVVRFADHIDSVDFNKRCEKFFKDNCHVVDLTLHADEHTHEYFDLFKEYQQIVEDALRDFMDREGLESPRELYGKLKQCYDQNPFAQEYLNYCLNCMEFESFAKSLKRYWRAFAKNHNLLTTEQLEGSESLSSDDESQSFDERDEEAKHK